MIQIFDSSEAGKLLGQVDVQLVRLRTVVDPTPSQAKQHPLFPEGQSPSIFPPAPPSSEGSGQWTLICRQPPSRVSRRQQLIEVLADGEPVVYSGPWLKHRTAGNADQYLEPTCQPNCPKVQIIACTDALLKSSHMPPARIAYRP